MNDRSIAVLLRQVRNIFRNLTFYLKSDAFWLQFKLWSYSIIFIVFLPPLVLSFSIKSQYLNKQFDDVDGVPKTRIAIVFGAGLKDKGTAPGTMLEDRLETAVELYKNNKIQKILLTGDNNKVDYDETSVMYSYVLKNGVKDADVIVDENGKRTYDSCFRAKRYYGVNSALLITQSYHLPRALYLCDMAGINVKGFIADKQNYQAIFSNRIREFFALPLAYWDVWVVSPEIEPSEQRGI